MLEAGLVGHFYKKYTSKTELCQNPELQKVELQPLKLPDLYGVFILYFGGNLVYT